MKRKLVIVLFLGVLVAGLLYSRHSRNVIYGNDTKSVYKKINEIKMYSNSSIEILETYDFDDDRIVTFLSDTWPAYITFSKDKNENYVYTGTKMSRHTNFSKFIIPLVGHSNNDYLISVKNRSSSINKYYFTANGKRYDVNFNTDDDLSTYTKIDYAKTTRYLYYFDENEE